MKIEKTLIEPLPNLRDAEEIALLRELHERIERDVRRAFFGGWPEGYQPGKGMPGTLQLNRRPVCGCTIIHTCGYVCC